MRKIENKTVKKYNKLKERERDREGEVKTNWGRETNKKISHWVIKNKRAWRIKRK